MTIHLTHPISVILYEDKLIYAQSFKTLAQRHRILVHHVTNVDSLLECLLQDTKKIQFVILDARAFLHEGQTEGSESETNLIKIFIELNKIENQTGRRIPCAINTGFADIKFSHQNVVPCPIFDKGQEEQLLEYIKEQYLNSEVGQLYSLYSEIMFFCEKHFNEANFSLLIKLLSKDRFKSKLIEERIRNLGTLRVLNEHIFELIFEKYLLSPVNVIQGPSSKVNDIAYYLKDVKNDIPPHIFGYAINIQKTASHYGSHTRETAAKVPDYPSSFTLISLTTGFFEIINWVSTKIN